MDSFTIRKKFINFFKERGHKIVPSSSLIPEDKTVLLTSAGMQQFIPYFSGEKDVIKDFGTRHLASIQKCFRAVDIEEIGDDTHHTFFEMLGNWSIGEDKETGYFKEGAIKLALDFFVEELGLDKRRFKITIFKGEKGIPRDEESFKIWQKYGIPKESIYEFGFKDNFWGPVAKTGPCGPCSEIHYDRGEEYGCKSPDCGPNCKKCNRFVELWNLVFMEYNKKDDQSFERLPQRNVDTGIGLERLTAVLEEKTSAYETEIFLPLIKKIEEVSGRSYLEDKKPFRVIADHLRGSVFLISDGVLPSNIERGYILRRIIRRALRYAKILQLPKNSLVFLAKELIKQNETIYPELQSSQETILTVLQKEEERFEKVLDSGLSAVEKVFKKTSEINGKTIFHLYESYGIPFEFVLELANRRGITLSPNIKDEFDKEMQRHQQVSRAGAERKFGGVGKEAGYEETKLHTATHLLQSALRKILGDSVRQMGSDITSERLRFDFSFHRKLTPEEIKKVEDLVNQKIKEKLEVRREEMPYKEAIEKGALAFFKEKYPEIVSVYSIGNFSVSPPQIFSMEICAGPHVKNTSELGRFKIIKEESSGAGVRRIRAILEKE